MGNQRIKMRIGLLVYLCLSMVLPICANDFLFTSINTSHGLSDNQIRYILQLPDGRMVFTTNGNVNLYDGIHFSYLHRTDENVYPLKQYDGFYRIYQSGDSLLWVKDFHKLMGINLYKEEYIREIESYFQAKNLSGSIENLFADSSGRIWVLTDHKLQELQTGISLTLPEEDTRQLQDLNTEGDSLYLFYDTGEVDSYDITGRKRLYSSAAYTAAEQKDFARTSLVVKAQKGFYQLRNGRKGGLFHFNPRQRTWKKLLEQNYTLNTLIITPGNEKAYITCVHGFWILDLMNGKQQYIPILETKNGQLLSTEISTIFQDRQGGLWIGTLNRGLLYYHPAMHKLTYVGRNSFPVTLEKDIAVESFAEDHEGTVYLKEHTHVYRLFTEKDGSRILIPEQESSIPAEIKEKLNKKDENTFFKDKNYTALCTDTRGWTWAGTADGLELFRQDEQTPRVFYRENGLSNNFVQGIIEDNHHDIWVTTSNGISRIHINPENSEPGFINFNQLDGALEGEYITGAVFKASDGTLYFGGIDGFNIFNPDHESTSPGLPYAPVFTTLRLYGEKANLPQAAPYTKELELNYNQNFLTFEFSALNYINSERTYYRYQLEGIDKDWMNALTSGPGNATVGNGILQASYTNLSPGKFTFKVMASDNLLQWNGKITAIKLTIHAPWWKTTTAYIIYLLILLLMTVGSIRLYVYWSRKKMERRHKEEILLLRIRNLIEQCSNYEAGQKAHLEKNDTVAASCSANEEQPDHPKPDSAESAFLARAIEQVEKNLHVPGYSVEQLSRDLCMERTGLYRKLVTLLDQSPSLFIRNIRLQRAAQLLTESGLSIAEIAERTGFSSSSYLSKCFQEMYGCRPSEYAGKTKKST